MTTMKKIKSTLFARLFMYFFIIVSIPLISLTIVSTTITKRKVIDGLKINLSTQTQIQKTNIEELFEEYRHKAYLLSKNEKIINILSNNNSTTLDNNQISEIYNILFSTMKGDTYLAEAIITSLDGEKRFSTHPFPEEYDLRTNSKILDIASPLMYSKPFTNTKITANEGYSNNNNVSLIMLRYIFDESSNPIGYVIINVYEQSFKETNNPLTLATSLLVDTNSFVAAELDNSGEFYTFNNYPGLNSRGHEEFSEKTIYNNNYVLSMTQISSSSFYIVNYIKDQTFNDNLQQILILSLTAILIGVLLSIFIAYFLAKQITHPIKHLINNMRQVEEGNLAISIEENSIYELQELNDSFNNMVIQIVNLLQKTKESQKRIYEAEKESLQSQINPHFLFNTLNTIKSIAKLNDQQDIYTISIKLGKLLRSSIYNNETNVKLEKSLELVQSYLTIQKLRFSDKLEIEYDIDESLLQIETPKLIIQPLVENAIIHGLSPKMGKWFLKLEIKKINNYIEINCIDNGIGFEDTNKMSNIESFANTNHVGIYNVYKRLKLEYNDNASLTFKKRSVEGTIATIKIPL